MDDNEEVDLENVDDDDDEEEEEEEEEDVADVDTDEVADTEAVEPQIVKENEDLDDESNVDDDVEEDEDDDEVMAAVVVENEDDDDNDTDDDDEEEVAVEAAIVENKPGLVRSEKQPPAKRTKKEASPAFDPPSLIRQKFAIRSKIKAEVDDTFNVVSPENFEAASDARALLQETVPTLPVWLADCSVRSFGRLFIDQDMTKNSFATTTALYPIGFSCDRYEFSPAHGRSLKLRCSILSGRIIKQKQQASGLDVSYFHDGPIFRIMWGQGIDEDDDTVEYAYSPSTHSAPIMSNALDAVAVADPGNTLFPKTISPEPGMRVKVRFDQGKHYYGTINQVTQTVASKKKRKQNIISIQYDDGFSEEIMFPDPDVTLLLPGVEEEVDSKGRVELVELNRKPVQSVIGETPLEAWGKVLIKFGMVDEVIFEAAHAALQQSREESYLDAKNKLRPLSTNARRDISEDGLDSTPSPSPLHLGDGDREEKKDSDLSTFELQDGAETPTQEEVKLRARVQALLLDLSRLAEEDRTSSIMLANARVRRQGPLLCNPFNGDEQSKSQQLSWLATAVRREKMRMGSTGNKRKVVTALDLLERNDTFYSFDTESLIEGLPGSEYCSSYVFQALRTGGTIGNRGWVNEAKLKREKEAFKKLEKKRENQEKENQEREKEREKDRKRKQREDERDARKRQKLEEEDLKKRARIEERVSRLRLQVEDRLFNEASFQREKVVSTVARSMSKEFIRRRKLAEIVAAQAVLDTKHISLKTNSICQALPQLGLKYDEELLRVWNFFTTFGAFFVERGYVSKLPTLNSLQSAINVLRQDSTTYESKMSKRDAVDSLTELAVSLCKPLATSLTRVLFASLIALYPTLQKDFGAAFFNEINSTQANDAIKASNPDVLLPVNKMTWQEVARSSFISDALSELGYQRHETAHILRGYRSAGHPNSKEARRLRKAEDFWVALIRQEVDIRDEIAEDEVNQVVRMMIQLPCKPICEISDFRFHLNILMSLADPSPADIQKLLSKSVAALTTSHDSNEYRRDLEMVKELADDAVLSKADAKAINKIRIAVAELYEKTAGPASESFASLAASGKHFGKWPWQLSQVLSNVRRDIPEKLLGRQQMGLLNALKLTRSGLKRITHQRERYMEAAIILKEEENRKKSTDEDDDEDEEDDEDGVVATIPSEPHEDKSHEGRKMDNELTKTKSDLEKNSASNEASSSSSQKDLPKIGKPTVYDDFCGDIPTAPEFLRRCLAVLRTLCLTQQSVTFLNPIDPQVNPGYYDTILRPMCLREIGRHLLEAIEQSKDLDGNKKKSLIELTVTEFARNVRLLERNTLSYASAGPNVISMSTEFMRIFERLFFDWVLAPDHALPALEDLDDDKCVEHHVTDEESTVLFCDGCEGKYNINRLTPPLLKVPKGDWYCPRCMTGRWWGDLDPRIGKLVQRVESTTGVANAIGACGHVRKCLFRQPEEEGAKATLMYLVEFESDNEYWSLEEVDKALEIAKTPVPSIRFLEAVAESPGYGSGVDYGFRKELFPIPMNPTISDSASQVLLSSSVFRDTIAASGSLILLDPKDMTAVEWLRLLSLLLMKCSASDAIQSVTSKMESDAAEATSKGLERISKINDISQVLPEVGCADEETQEVEPTGNTPQPSILPLATPVHEMAQITRHGTSSTLHSDIKSTLVVDAGAIQFMDDADMGSDVSASKSLEHPQFTQSSHETSDAHSVALYAKKTRRKAIEDSITAYCVKNQLRPTAASFQEDNISPVVDSSLTSKEPGLDFYSVRCRKMVCFFCGLTDVALGLPLVRVPDEQEWLDLIPHCSRNRRTHLVAEIPSQRKCPENRLVALTLRVGGELFSMPDNTLKNFKFGGMMEFVPRGVIGFQHELLFRDNTSLPFVSGSLSAHECCAVAAHNSRKDVMVQKFKEREAEFIEKDAALSCGRTLEIGKDTEGRSYWKFAGDTALFVCLPLTHDAAPTPAWYRYGEPEAIASVMLSLGKQKIIKDLHRLFPKASIMAKNGTWSDELVKKRFPKAFLSLLKDDTSSNASKSDTAEIEVVGGFEPYEVDEDVLVKSNSGKLLWDASITGISRFLFSDQKVLRIDAYRVQYKGWNSRYTEWVEPRRLVESVETNQSLQKELLEELARSKCGLPSCLNLLAAKDFLRASDRARGNVDLPDFARIAHVNYSHSLNEATFRSMKAAILAVEAALPIGSIDNTDYGPWRPEVAQRWRRLVQSASGPARLMQCVIFLEDLISEDWVKADVGHLRSCLPARWKAVGDASPSSLAIRVILFDRSLLYGNVDRKRFNRKKSKTPKI